MSIAKSIGGAMKGCCFFILSILLLAACTMPQAPATATLSILPPTATQTVSPSPTQTITQTKTPDSARHYQPAWGIDYAHPEKYLTQGEQTRLSDPDVAADLRLEQNVNSPDQLYMLGRIYWWISGEFKTWSARGATIGKVKTDELLADRHLGGCHDGGLVYASLARELGYPTVVVDALGLAWAKQFQSGEQGSYAGHVFVEVYVNGKWVLVDSTNNWYVASGYDPSNPIIPLGEKGGYYVMRKGLDTWGYGVMDAKSLNKLMEETARQLDLGTLVYPQYEFQRFR
jgi:hypothetical protein